MDNRKWFYSVDIDVTVMYKFLNKTGLVSMLEKLQRRTKFLTIQLLRIKDNAHTVSLGFTIGFLVNFVPSFGLGPIISTTAAKLLKGNAIAGLIGGVLFIWVFPFLFYLNIIVGDFFIPIEINELDGELEDAEEVIDAGLSIGKAFFVGMIINMITFGILMYYITLYIIKKHRVRLLRLVHKSWKLKR